FNIFDDPGFTVVSDTFSLSIHDFSGVGGTPNTVLANFISAGAAPLAPLSGGTVINLLEKGGIQDLGTVTFNDVDGAPIDAIDFQFVSDVPEPSSLMLSGVGLLALITLRSGFSGWQRRHWSGRTET